MTKKKEKTFTLDERQMYIVHLALERIKQDVLATPAHIAVTVTAEEIQELQNDLVKELAK